MEWFGITCYGVADPIKDMIKEGYREPEVQPNIRNVIDGDPTKTFTELVRELDCYSGRIDGFAYRSADRLRRMRKKGMFKPVGPCEMYRFPGTDSMKYGYCDPALLGKDWYKQRVFKPNPTTEISRFLDEAKKSDKYFRM